MYPSSEIKKSGITLRCRAHLIGLASSTFAKANSMKILLSLLLIFFVTSASADECTGDSGYQVCTSTDVDSNGDTTVSSYDTEGNNYSVTSGTREHADGVSEAFSSDSEGNEYSVKSWCDNSGCHTSDSDGNMCTVTAAGETIGC